MAKKTTRKKPPQRPLKTNKAARKPRKKEWKRDPEETYFDLAEALEYLNDEGYKVGKSKLYEDAGTRFGKQPDGSVTKRTLDKYANDWLDLIDASDKAAPSAEAKAREEAALAKARRLKLEHELEVEKGKWVKKSEQSQMLAARAALLKDSVGTNFIHRYAEDIIELVGGNQDKAPDLIVFYIDRVEDHFDQYSRPMVFAAPGVITETPDEELRRLEADDDIVEVKKKKTRGR